MPTDKFNPFAPMGTQNPEAVRQFIDKAMDNRPVRMKDFLDLQGQVFGALVSIAAILDAIPEEQRKRVEEKTADMLTQLSKLPDGANILDELLPRKGPNNDGT